MTDSICLLTEDSPDFQSARENSAVVRPFGNVTCGDYYCMLTTVQVDQYLVEEGLAYKGRSPILAAPSGWDDRGKRYLLLVVVVRPATLQEDKGYEDEGLRSAAEICCD